MYRKSYERECITIFMGTSGVLKGFKIARAISKCNLRTLKTSRVTINHVMHEQVHTIFFYYYIFNKITPLRSFACHAYHIKRFNGFPNAHMFYCGPIKKYHVVIVKSGKNTGPIIFFFKCSFF